MVTRKDIAREVQVSVSTVGMILDGHGARYSATTREKVLRAAREMNYKPNLTGRSLRTGKSFLLGILYSRTNRFLLADFLRGVMEALEGDQYSPIVFSHEDAAEEAEGLRRCVDRNVDGLIVNVGMTPEGAFQRGAHEAATRQRIPMVEVFGRFLEQCPSVNFDSAAAGDEAVRFLIRKGHRRIAFLVHERYRLSEGKRAGSHRDAFERCRAYEGAMQDGALRPTVVTHPISGELAREEEFVEGGMDALAQLKALSPAPTAVICYNDLEAYGLIRACRLQGLSVPGDIAIVGYGDLDLSALTEPRLTTFRPPAFDAGRDATRMILASIGGRPPASVLLRPTLVARDSA
jgi:LacI family transcriptional regulator